MADRIDRMEGGRGIEHSEGAESMGGCRLLLPDGFNREREAMVNRITVGDEA